MWAAENGIASDARGWAKHFQNNLFAPIDPASLQEFIEGGEADPSGRSGRIAAPHSSTALACNMFDWWRRRDLTPLANAFGAPFRGFIGFEQTHDIGLNREPQLDVEMNAGERKPVGVEVKLREPYGTISNPFSDKYFTTEGLWDHLPNLESLARGIKGRTVRFETLHAAQLIKHSLGLAKSYRRDFTLIYLWHFVPSEVGMKHKSEVEHFSNIANQDIDFVSVTVEDVLAGFHPDSDSQPWLDYMVARYVMPTRQ